MKKIATTIVALSILAITSSAFAINVNSATKEELDSSDLYRTGPTTAAKIVAARDMMPDKRFTTVKDITDNVSGIGDMWAKTNEPIITFNDTDEKALQDKLKNQK